MNGIRLFLLVGGVFGALAATIASLITWNELQHHRLPRRQMFSEISRVALLVLVVFLIVSVVSGLVLLQVFVVHLR